MLVCFQATRALERFLDALRLFLIPAASAGKQGVGSGVGPNY
jgi:hypothetical protein